MTLWSDIAQWRGPVLHHSGTIADHKYVVVHTADGSYEGTIAWQKNENSDNSSHFIVDYDGKIAQVNDTANRSGAQKAGNPYSIAIENAGNENTPLTDAQLTANAKILVKAHQVHGIPLQLTGNVNTRGLGHHSMGAESGVDWGHSLCPGEIIKAQKPEILRRAKEIVSPTKRSKGMQFWSVTGVPAGQVDIFGNAIVNLTRTCPTPKGPFAYMYGEIIDPYNDAPKQTITMTWPRFLQLCQAWAPEPLDMTELAQQISDHYPVNSVTRDVILGALTSEEGMHAFVELLDQDEVRAILAEEVEYAEDH